jgi:hypothetical protein
MGVNEILNSKKATEHFITKLITVVFYMSVFFPFCQILPTDSDTQPYALILSIMRKDVINFDELVKSQNLQKSTLKRIKL